MRHRYWVRAYNRVGQPISDDGMSHHTRLGATANAWLMNATMPALGAVWLVERIPEDVGLL